MIVADDVMMVADTNMIVADGDMMDYIMIIHLKKSLYL